MKFPIRIKLLAGFGLILLLACGLVLFTYILTDQYSRAERISSLTDTAQTATDSLQDYFLGIEEDYRNLAIDYKHQLAGLPSNFTILAEHEVQDHPATRQLAVLTLAGREISKFDASGPVPAAKLSVTLPSDAFNQAKTGSIGISKAYFITGQQYPEVDLFLPVTDEKGTVTTILKGQIELQDIQDILSRLDLGRTGVAYIIDSQGQLISPASNTDLSDTSTILHRPIVSKLFASKQSTITQADHIYVNQKNVAVVASSNRISILGWVVVVEQSESEAFNQLYFIRNMLLGSLGVVMLALLALGLLLSDQLARPIKRLRLGTEALQQGKTVAPIDIHTGDELEALAQSFNTMASQLQQRELSLEESNRTLAVERDRQVTLLQSLTDGVFATDSLGQVLLFNRSAETITELRASKVLGQPIDDAMPLYRETEIIPLHAYVDQSTEAKTKYNQQGLTFKKPDGTSMQLSLTAAPVTLAQSADPGWIVTFHDITQEKELESMKLDFVSMAAHELRTPLTALRGYLSLIISEAGGGMAAEIKMFLDRSLISANQLSALVENLLNVSRIERGALKVELVPLQLADIISGAMTNLEEVAKQKQIKVTFEKPTTVLPLVMADQFRLGEVVTNLVANGINYTATKGRVTVTLHQEGNMVITSVADTGEGIAAPAMSHLFTKFYRAQASLAQGSKGTGLGLYISKAIIDAHGGKIWAESVEGQGSTFFFSLPIAVDDKKAMDKDKSLLQ